jgi:hypothetical protein
MWVLLPAITAGVLAGSHHQQLGAMDTTRCEMWQDLTFPQLIVKIFAFMTILHFDIFLLPLRPASLLLTTTILYINLYFFHTLTNGSVY